MIKLAANLSFLYQEVDFLDRFSLAARDGFKGVEFLFPYNWKASELKTLLDDNGLSQALFNISAGDWSKGQRGLASLPGQQQNFQHSVAQALEYAEILGCRQIHVMSGLRDTAISHDAQREIFMQNLLKAAEMAKICNIDLLIEPINNQDMPHYFLNDFDMVENILEALNTANIKLQFDIYHCHKIHGDVPNRLCTYSKRIKHIQIADPPARNEPGTGVLDYAHLFKIIEEIGYSGWIGCEYKPSSSTQETLSWAQDYLTRPTGKIELEI